MIKKLAFLILSLAVIVLVPKQAEALPSYTVSVPTTVRFQVDDIVQEIPADEAAYVYSYYPDNNYGTSTIVVVGTSSYGTGSEYNALIRWNNLSLPLGYELKDAYFKLYLYDVYLPTEFVVAKITADWDESTITWNTAPSASNIPSSQYIFKHEAGWVRLDDEYFKTLIGGWIRGTTANYGIRLDPITVEDATHWHKFYSDDTSKPPKIVLIYRVPTVSAVSVEEGLSVKFEVYQAAAEAPENITVKYDIYKDGSPIASDLTATYNNETGLWESTYAVEYGVYNITNIRTYYNGELTDTRNESVVVTYAPTQISLLSPTTGDISLSKSVYIEWSEALPSASLVAVTPNGTYVIDVSGLSSKVIDLVDGWSTIYINGSVGGSIYYTNPATILIDTEDPTIEADMPTEAVSCAMIEVTVNATDNLGVEKVVLEANGPTTVVDESTTTASDGLYHFTLSLPEGTYNITATAYDVVGRSTSVSSSLSVISGGTTAFITSPKPSSVFYTNQVNISWLAPLFNSTLEVEMSNGTTTYFDVENTNNITLELAEGRNWITLNGTLCNNALYSQPLDIIIDQYLPSAPTITSPLDRANLTQDLVNVSWQHDGFDTEWYIVKAWRYEPSYWANSVTVPVGDSWQLIQLAGSGTYYLQVVARDAAGNEASSDIVEVNVSASSVGLLNLTLNRTGFSFSLTNTLNESQDANWNLTISLLTRQQVEFRQGTLSFYPNETKVHNGTWNQNLSDNVYIAEFWVEDSYGRASGYITSFIAIPPFSEQGVIPLTISQGVWETEPAELGEKIRLTSVILITNANNVESPQQNVNFALPNVTISKLMVKNKLTGASYSASANETAGTGTFVAPSIAPYSSIVFQAIAETDEVNYTLERVNGTEGLKEIGGKMWRKYLANFSNPIPYEVTVYLTENETLKWDCGDCSISGGHIALSLAPEEGKQIVAWVLEPQEELNVTERPFSVFLNWAISTNMGALFSFFGMVVGVGAALASGGRKYE